MIHTLVPWLKLGEFRRRSMGLNSAKGLPAILLGDEVGVPFWILNGSISVIVSIPLVHGDCIHTGRTIAKPRDTAAYEPIVLRSLYGTFHVMRRKRMCDSNGMFTACAGRDWRRLVAATRL